MDVRRNTGGLGKDGCMTGARWGSGFRKRRERYQELVAIRRRFLQEMQEFMRLPRLVDLESLETSKPIEESI